jgi:hypothetical protein
MALPLVSIGGGEDTIHDWNYLLSKFGLLRWDQTVGSIAYVLGLLTIAASIVVGFYLSFQQEERGSE